VEQHLRAVVPGTFMVEIDVQEQYLNFMLHDSLKPFAGVDFTGYFLDDLWVETGTQKCTMWE
jgi:hypothetical protein